MAKPKLLQFPRALPLFMLFAAVWSGCAGSRSVDSASAAEKYAVDLANRKCEKEFGKSPFKTGRFPAARSGDRWLWGWLDPQAAQGYTAQVSFHADRTEPEVAVGLANAHEDMEEPDAPSLNGVPESPAFTRQPKP